MSSNPSQATSFLLFPTKVITFEPGNIFELIWYSEWPLVGSMVLEFVRCFLFCWDISMKAKIQPFWRLNLSVSLWFEAFSIIILLVTQYFVWDLTNIVFQYKVRPHIGSFLYKSTTNHGWTSKKLAFIFNALWFLELYYYCLQFPWKCIARKSFWHRKESQK